MSFFEPVWPVPGNVRSIVTTCVEGNLATYVGDATLARRNRDALMGIAGLPAMPRFMDQVHGVEVYVAGSNDATVPQADAAVTDLLDVPLVVLAADCLPILLSNASGSRVGVVHAGWRGLSAGVIGRTLEHFRGETVTAWLGPAIGPCHYEVDVAVKKDFATSEGFKAVRSGHYKMDLYVVATGQLKASGVESIHGGGFCTWCDPRFYSHRQDQSQARFGTVIWIRKS